MIFPSIGVLSIFIMRLVIQRVKSASVTLVDSGKISGAIDTGLCVLVGVGECDARESEEETTQVLDWAVKQITETKFWPDENGKPWKASVASSPSMPVLLVSQFTLYAKLYKKGKLDFHNAMSPTPAKDMYDKLVEKMKNKIGDERVATGEFGAMMDVSLVNDGPVTLMLDSDEKN